MPGSGPAPADQVEDEVRGGAAVERDAGAGGRFQVGPPGVGRIVSEARVHLPAIPARGALADLLGFEQDVRPVGFSEVQRSGEAGQAPADNGDVRAGVAVQGLGPRGGDRRLSPQRPRARRGDRAYAPRSSGTARRSVNSTYGCQAGLPASPKRLIHTERMPS